VELLSGV